MEIIKKSLWMVYPLMVMVFIFLSLNYLFGAGQEFQRFVDRQKNVGDLEVRIASLKNKLAVVSGVNVVETENNLKTLLEAMPPARRLWVVVSEVRLAASESGLVVDAFRGVGGEVRESSGAAEALVLDVDLKVGGVGELRDFLSKLESKKPLVKVKKIKYDGNQVTVSVEGAWSAWTKLTTDTNLPLKPYGSLLAAVLKKLEGYEGLGNTSQGVSSGSGEVNTNPF